MISVLTIKFLTQYKFLIAKITPVFIQKIEQLFGRFIREIIQLFFHKLI